MPDPDPVALEAAIRGTLAQMAQLAPDPRTLLPLGPHADAISRVASAEGWHVADPPSATPTVALLFQPDAPPDPLTLARIPSAHPDVTLICVTAHPAPGTPAAPPPHWHVRHALPFHPRETLGHWLARTARACRVPEPLVALCARLAARARFDHTVGHRRLRHRPDGRQTILLQPDGADPAPRTPPSQAPSKARALAVTCLGIGHFPIASGTVASLVPCAPALLLAAPEFAHARLALLALLAGLSSAVCLLLDRWAQEHFLEEDPREVVLDEVAGMALALLFLPAHAAPATILLGFLLFRLLDILKPGISRIERLKLPGTILWDDLLAGLGAGLGLLALRMLPS